MKKVILFIVLAFIVQATASSQACLPQGIYFHAQYDIDNFQTFHPNCTKIEGDVTIEGADITNLDGLSVLTSIGGYLEITSNPVLTNLTGLINLTSIGSHLYIRSNNNLNGLTGLNNLSQVGEHLEISDNDAITNLVGLEELTFIPGRLKISGNNELADLEGLSNLTSIGENLRISMNNTLHSLTELDNLTSIGSGLSISYNGSLTSLTGLENINSIGAALYISYNTSLLSLTALENISATSITDLTITNNPSLTLCEAQNICNYLTDPNGEVNIYGNVQGCNSPNEVANTCNITLPCLPYGNYYFLSQNDINAFQTDFPDCTALEGSVLISGEDINNLEGLNVLTSIGGRLSISGNTELSSISELGNLTHIGGALLITHNPDLNNLTGLDNLIALESIAIRNNDKITDLTGLNSVTYLSKDLWLWENYALTSLVGLENLDSIGTYIKIWNNNNLTSLESLANLTSIGGSLDISGNNYLTNLTGLGNIESASISELYIYDNPLLSTCEVQSVCNYLADNNFHTYIHDNSPGCNSPEEVELACTVSLAEASIGAEFILYPNPATDELLISSEDGIGIYEASIYNRLGQRLIAVSYPAQKIDVSSLPAGVYFIELKTRENRVVEKIIIK